MCEADTSERDENTEDERFSAYPPSIQAGIPKLAPTPEGGLRAPLGLLLRKAIKASLFGHLAPVAAAFVVGGILMIVVERVRVRRGVVGQEGLENVTPARALAIGLGQCLSLWPGASRALRGA